MDCATEPIHNEKGHLVGHKYFCDCFPDGVPSKCVDVKELLIGEEEFKKVCQHFQRGAPQHRKPMMKATA